MTKTKIAPCRHCPHPYEAHADYLWAGSMLCWTKPEWVDKMAGYQSCDCPGYRPDLDAAVIGARRHGKKD